MTELIDKDLAEVLNNEMYKYSSKDERHYAGDFAEDGSIYIYNTCDKYQSIETQLKKCAELYRWITVSPNTMWFGSKPETAGVWMNDKDFKTEAIKAGVYKVMHNGTKKTGADLLDALHKAICKAYDVVMDDTWIMQAGNHVFSRKKDEMWDSEKRAVRNHIVKSDQYIMSYLQKDLRTTVERNSSNWTYKDVPKVNVYDTIDCPHELRELASLITDNDTETLDYIDHLTKIDYDYLVNALRVDQGVETHFDDALRVLGESEHGRKFDFKTIY